jgi:hypothetical protein
MTYQPASGENRTSKYIHNEKWLDLNAFQSGHSVHQASPWDWVREDLQMEPTKPTLDMEPCYEDHSQKPRNRAWQKKEGYFDAHEVRKRINRTVFAGAAGGTYGHHHFWHCMDTLRNPPVYASDTIIPLRQALTSKAANQMNFL